MTYQINSAGLPPLNDTDLTVNLWVGSIAEAVVEVDGATINHTYDSFTNILTFNIDASQQLITVTLTDGAELADLGTVSVGMLKDNKAWAYSHGFDDNVNLKEGITIFESYGWQGTLFMIGNIIDDTRQEDWIVDAPDIRTYVENGWSIGSHSWDSLCDDANMAAIEQSTDRIEGIVATSTKPDYVVTSFAAPCFDEAYHPVILDMRDNMTSTILFNESGNDSLLLLEGTGDVTYDGVQAYSFNFDRPIGRDLSYEINDIDTLKSRFDWMSTHSSGTAHFWFNTLSHGKKEDEIDAGLDYLYATYGPNGTDEVWVAPSEEIYAYQIVRDRVEVELVAVSRVTE